MARNTRGELPRADGMKIPPRAEAEEKMRSQQGEASMKKWRFSRREILQGTTALAAAMLINLLAAGIAGVLAPLALERLKIDPAMASGVMVTTVTDVVGFFAFLGLATLLLL